MKKMSPIFLVWIFVLSGALFAGNGTIIEQWSKVKAPAVVDLTPVKVDPATTALLILDIEQRVDPHSARGPFDHSGLFYQ